MNDQRALNTEHSRGRDSFLGTIEAVLVGTDGQIWCGSDRFDGGEVKYDSDTLVAGVAQCGICVLRIERDTKRTS